MNGGMDRWVDEKIDKYMLESFILNSSKQIKKQN